VNLASSKDWEDGGELAALRMEAGLFEVDIGGWVPSRLPGIGEAESFCAWGGHRGLRIAGRDSGRGLRRQGAQIAGADARIAGADARWGRTRTRGEEAEPWCTDCERLRYCLIE
jgi:hypothetical protein